MSAPPPPLPVPASSADAYALLQSYHPSPSATHEVLTTKILNRPLPLHATAHPPTATTTTTSSSSSSNARDARRATKLAKHPPRRRRKPQPLSAKEKRQLRVHDTGPPHQLKWTTFLPLHELWLAYARSLAAMGGGAAAMAQRMAAADFHGALVEVVRSRAVDRVGIRGIVVKETKGVVVVVTERDGGKTVPKEFTVFRVTVPPSDEERRTLGRTDMVFELQGAQLMFRAAERAARKFKAKAMLDL